MAGPSATTLTTNSFSASKTGAVAATTLTTSIDFTRRYYGLHSPLSNFSLWSLAWITSPTAVWEEQSLWAVSVIFIPRSDNSVWLMEPIEPLIPPDYFPGVVYSLAAAFFSFSAVSALYAVFWWLRDPKFSLVKLIFSLLPVSTAGLLCLYLQTDVKARGVVLAVSNPLHYLTRQLQQQSTSEFVLGSMPGYLMISIYLLLSLFWYGIAVTII